MNGNIPNQVSQHNTFSSYPTNGSRLTSEPSLHHELPTHIPRLPYNLLCVMASDHDRQGFSQRTSQEMARRFNCHAVTVRKAWMFLEELGFTKSSLGGKGHPSKRCITLAAYSWLESQQLHYTLHYNSHTPYISLSEEERDNYLSLEDDQNCGELEPEVELELKLNRLTQIKGVMFQHREQIKTALSLSNLSIGQKLMLMHRVIAADKKKSIEQLRNYIFTAIFNEEKLNQHFEEQKKNQADDCYWWSNA